MELAVSRVQRLQSGLHWLVDGHLHSPGIPIRRQPVQGEDAVGVHFHLWAGKDFFVCVSILVQL